MANTEFSVVPSHDRETSQYFLQIAALGGKKPEELDIDELANLDMLLNLGNATSQEKKLRVRALIEFFGILPHPRTYTELGNELAALLELARDGTNQHLTFGSNLASYTKMLKASRLEGTPNRALLVGALTVRTIQEFSAFIHKSFSPVECVVVDIIGDLTARVDPSIAAFKKADALDLPFVESFDTVHTNVLLPFIESPDYSLSDRAKRALFYRGVYRALRSGGRLMMVDKLNDVADPVRVFNQELQNSGFRNIQIESAQFFDKRRDLDRFLRGTASTPDPRQLITGSSFFAVSAQK